MSGTDIALRYLNDLSQAGIVADLDIDGESIAWTVCLMPSDRTFLDLTAAAVPHMRANLAFLTEHAIDVVSRWQLAHMAGLCQVQIGRLFHFLHNNHSKASAPNSSHAA
jgi:hypothetical protein